MHAFGKQRYEPKQFLTRFLRFSVYELSIIYTDYVHHPKAKTPQLLRPYTTP